MDRARAASDWSERGEGHLTGYAIAAYRYHTVKSVQTYWGSSPIARHRQSAGAGAVKKGGAGLDEVFDGVGELVVVGFVEGD